MDMVLAAALMGNGHFRAEPFAGEHAIYVALDGGIAFLAHHLAEMLAGELSGRQPEPVPIGLVVEPVAPFRVDIRDERGKRVGHLPQLLDPSGQKDRKSTRLNSSH